MAKQITTLYLDSTGIRLMVSRGRRISRMAQAPLDAALAGVSAKVRETETAAAVRQLLKSSRIGAKKVIVGMSGRHCLSRPAVLPQLPRAMLEEAVVREAKRVMPVPPEQLYISWQVVSAVEGKMQAFMVAMPREVADGLLRVVQQVGLKPYLMDIKPLALARLVPEPTAIMLDVQAKEFDIVVMIDGTPQPIRTVPFSEAAQSLSDRLPAVVDELKRTILFYNSNYPDRPIPADIPLYVSGELAADEELSRSLAQAVGYRTLPLPVPFKLPKQKIDPSPYLVNIGLALKESSGEARPLRPNINTLPVPYQPRQISLGKLMALPAVAVAIGLIVMLSMTVQDAAGSIYDVQTRLDTTKAVLDKRQAQKKDLTAQIAVLEQELAGARTARDAFAAVLDGINRDGDRIDGDLKAAVGNVVTALELTNIVHSGKALEISGTAPSEAEVLAYARNLYATGRFAELTITNVTRKESTGEVVVTENTTAPRVWVEFILDLKLKAAE